jgi:cAMP phosphodiesterase
MQIRVLGCSGGIGKNEFTSCYLINNDILIDAGTGLGNLAQDEMMSIDHVFITHAHMDHIACLPIFIDTTFSKRTTPVTIWANAHTIDLLKKHIFNNAIWPDFSVLPNIDNPFIRYQIIEDNVPITVSGVDITAIPVNHTIPTVAYQLTCKTGSFVICGDTGKQDDFWTTINNIPNLKGLAIETAFCNENEWLATLAKHLSPSMLFAELSKLTQPIPVYIMHLKPVHARTILEQLREYSAQYPLDVMTNDQIIEI